MEHDTGGFQSVLWRTLRRRFGAINAFFHL